MDKITPIKLVGRPCSLLFSCAVWTEIDTDLGRLCEDVLLGEETERAAILLSRMAAAGSRRRTLRGYSASYVPEPIELLPFLRSKPGNQARQAFTVAVTVGAKFESKQTKPRDLGLEELRRQQGADIITRATVIRLGKRIGWSAQETLDATPGELVEALQETK